jgi:hypothetical protein
VTFPHAGPARRPAADYSPDPRDSTWGYYIEALGLSADVLVGTTIETGNEIAARTDGEVKEIEAEIAAREARIAECLPPRGRRSDPLVHKRQRDTAAVARTWEPRSGEKRGSLARRTEGSPRGLSSSACEDSVSRSAFVG